MTDHIVIERSLLKLNEVFIYRIPPLTSSLGFRAEDWNLASPLATCSLTVLQIDDIGVLRFYQHVPKLDGPDGATEDKLFAESKIRLGENKMEHWVQPVTDSFRYFVVRISDESKGREAHIGMGFRERSDALNFKMALQDYEKSIEKDALFKNSFTNSNDEKDLAVSNSVHKLSLEEGEKIHINIKGFNSRGEGKAKNKSSFLRKPPPPAGSEAASDPTSEDDEEWSDFK